MQGNFGLKLYNSPKLPHIHARFIVMQMSRVNREIGYCAKLLLSNGFHSKKKNASETVDLFTPTVSPIT